MKKFSVITSVFFLCSLTQAYAGHKVLASVEFRHVDNPEIVAFAVAELRGEEKKLSEEEWVAAVKSHALYADIDINDDGVPERFLQYSYFCGTAGCVTSIYKRTGKLNNKSVSRGMVEHYEDICDEEITGNDPRPICSKIKRMAITWFILKTERSFIGRPRKIAWGNCAGGNLN